MTPTNVSPLGNAAPLTAGTVGGLTAAHRAILDTLRADCDAIADEYGLFWPVKHWPTHYERIYGKAA